MPKLIWKEWHEQSWKLGFGCVVLGAMALIGLHSRILPDETMMMWVCFIGLVLLPILSATGLIPAERSEHSFNALLALPVHPRKILAAKTMLGVLLVAGPMIAAFCVSLLISGNREMSDVSIVMLYLRFTLAALWLFVWMLALTVQLPNETRAALLSIGVLIIWAMASGIAWFMSPFTYVGTSLMKQHAHPTFIELTLIQLVIAIGLWIWTSMRLSAPVEDQ